MNSLGTPTKDQAEAYIATYALFQLCSKKEEKIYFGLPTIWRELWSEFLEEARLESESQERGVLKGLRKTLGIGEGRNYMDGGNTAKKKYRVVKGEVEGGNMIKDVPEQALEGIREAELIKESWSYKTNTPDYLHMLKGRKQLPIWAFKDEVLATIEREQVVIICGETGWYHQDHTHPHPSVLAN